MSSIQAIFLGSIGALSETSEIQRAAYNQALREAGLSWQWDRPTYQELLKDPGGKARLRRLSAEHGEDLSDEQIDAIHARKTELACARIEEEGTPLREGVAELIEQAIEQNIPVALVTSTYRQNIDAIAKAAGDKLPLDKLASIVTIDDVDQGKPNPDVYLKALERLGVDASRVVAVEDSAASVASARAANIGRVIATPGENTSSQDYSQAHMQVANLAGAQDRVFAAMN